MRALAGTLDAHLVFQPFRSAGPSVAYAVGTHRASQVASLDTHHQERPRLAGHRHVGPFSFAAHHCAPLLLVYASFLSASLHRHLSGCRSTPQYLFKVSKQPISWNGPTHQRYHSSQPLLPRPWLVPLQRPIKHHYSIVRQP